MTFTTTQVCQKHGYSRQRLYQIAAIRGITPAIKPAKHGMGASWSLEQVKALKPGKMGKHRRRP